MAAMTRKETVQIALLLVASSVVLYVFQLWCFHRVRDTFFYLLQDLAFLPLTILIVTVIVSSVISEREKRLQQHKMNMVIGAFFSDVGQPLLKHMCALVANADQLRTGLAIDPAWTERELRGAIDFVRAAQLEIAPQPERLTELRDMLARHRGFMLGLLENPVLLEHAAFTDLLWAVFHLEEELAARKSLDGLPVADQDHLANDVKRALSGLLVQWLEYMVHLSKDYPFLYSFAARTNPLRPGAKAEIAG